MKLKGVLELLRDFGTGTTIRALLSPKRTKPSETMEKHTVLLSELVATLEKKKLLFL